MHDRALSQPATRVADDTDHGRGLSGANNVERIPEWPALVSGRQELAGDVVMRAHGGGECAGGALMVGALVAPTAVSSEHLADQGSDLPDY